MEELEYWCYGLTSSFPFNWRLLLECVCVVNILTTTAVLVDALLLPLFIKKSKKYSMTPTHTIHRYRI